MFKKYLLLPGIFTLVIILALFSGCQTTDNPKLKVMTGTSLVAAIVEQVGGNHVEVFNLVPPEPAPRQL